MMKILRSRSLVVFGLLFVCFTHACGAEDQDIVEPRPADPSFERSSALDVEMVSAPTSVSHEVGSNCMSCHQAHGPGRGQFTAAGTIWNPDRTAHPHAVVELRTLPNFTGELVATFTADDLGNFYTTEPLPFPDRALYPSIRSADGKLKAFMPFPTLSGSCNVCHSGGFGVKLRNE